MPRRLLVLSIAIVVLMFGCSRTDPVSTDRAGTDVESAIRAGASRFPSGFYPLAIGNRWRYTRSSTTQLIVDGVPEPPEAVEYVEEFEQICVEMNGGGEYVVQAQRWYDAEGDSGVQHVRYRQDVTGLYEADMCLCDPPECVESPVGPASKSPYERMWEKLAPHLRDDATRAAVRSFWMELSAQLEASRRLSLESPPDEPFGFPELTRLKYPLYPGQNWAIRNEGGSFVFKAGVEAFEVMDLPVGQVPAYRVRVSPPGAVEEDEYLSFVQWWGQCGYMGSELHLRLRVFNPDGVPVFVIADDIEEVTEISLVDLRPCTIDRP